MFTEYKLSFYENPMRSVLVTNVFSAPKLILWYLNTQQKTRFKIGMHLNVYCECVCVCILLTCVHLLLAVWLSKIKQGKSIRFIRLYMNTV